MTSLQQLHLEHESLQASFTIDWKWFSFSFFICFISSRSSDCVVCVFLVFLPLCKCTLLISLGCLHFILSLWWLLPTLSSIALHHTLAPSYYAHRIFGCFVKFKHLWPAYFSSFFRHQHTTWIVITAMITLSSPFAFWGQWEKHQHHINNTVTIPWVTCQCDFTSIINT